MKLPLTRRDLDKLGCVTPGCPNNEEVYLHGMCHPGAPVRVGYDKAGFVVIECEECDKIVCAVGVALVSEVEDAMGQCELAESLDSCECCGESEGVIYRHCPECEGAGVEERYDKRGSLNLSCAECEGCLGHIAVAKGRTPMLTNSRN